jgi:hypothetical protein
MSDETKCDCEIEGCECEEGQCTCALDGCDLNFAEGTDIDAPLELVGE